MRRPDGLTLIEMLVTASILVMVLGIVSQFFISQSRAATLQKATDQATNATRTALALISWDVQNAGYDVVVSDTNKAIVSTNNAHQDVMTVRYNDLSLDPPARSNVRYSIDTSTGDNVASLRRAEYPETVAEPPQGMQPTIASVVALNVQFETRANAYATPLTSTTCATGQTGIPDPSDPTKIINCSVNWVWSDTPLRQVRRVKVQLLGRSEGRVPSYSSPVTSYTFDGGSTYAAVPGYVYSQTEQTFTTPNLGR